MKISEFKSEYNIGFSDRVLSDWIKDNRQKLKGIVILLGESRIRIDIIKPKELFDILIESNL